MLVSEDGALDFWQEPKPEEKFFPLEKTNESE
jgi:hypothetical protein